MTDVEKFIKAIVKANNPGDQWYQAYTPDVSDETARVWFKNTWLAEPERIIRNAGCVLVGPVKRVCNGTQTDL